MSARVYVLDDDDAVRASVLNLLAAEGHDARGFASAAALFAALFGAQFDNVLDGGGHTRGHDAPSCLVCDMNMPGIGGLDVAAELARRGHPIPIIFLTGFGTIPLSVQAMKAGAIEFLTKPAAPEALLRAVRNALDADAAELAPRRELAALRQRHASLTPRERETMELVIGGLLNKQVADALGVSDIMAKTHKRKVMEKMGARSLPDLVRYAERLQITSARSR